MRDTRHIGARAWNEILVRDQGEEGAGAGLNVSRNRRRHLTLVKYYIA